MSCRRTRRLLPLYVGGDLPEALARRVEAHLSRCEACREERRLYEASRQSLFALRGSDRRSPDLWPELRGRILAAGAPAARRSFPVRAAAAVLLSAAAAAGGALLLSLPAAAPERVAPELPAAAVRATGTAPERRRFGLAEVAREAHHDPFPTVTPPDPGRDAWDEF